MLLFGNIMRFNFQFQVLPFVTSCNVLNWEISSVPAERVGGRKMGGCHQQGESILPEEIQHTTFPLHML